MFQFDSGVLVPIVSFMIPIVAIVGGITAGIVRMILRHRMVELAQRERIAAIERGLDISQLPPLPTVMDDGNTTALYLSPRQVTLRRARGLLIGGIVTLGVSVGLSAMLAVLADGSEHAWAVGLIPGCIGLALLLSSAIMRSSAGEDDPTPPIQRQQP